MNLDYILPFAAVSEDGRVIDGLDDESELAHRIMLVNFLRLLGAVKAKKASLHFVTCPTQVILPFDRTWMLLEMAIRFVPTHHFQVSEPFCV